MKRHGNLYEKVISIDNMKAAALTAAKAYGRGPTVDRYYKDEEQLLNRLHQKLADGSFRPSKPQTFTIREPKERLITTCPFYPDKIVEQSIVQVIEPILLSCFTTDAYASIKGRGGHLMSQRIRRAMNQDRDGCRYALKLDIRHAFPSVDHDVLLAQLERKIKDNRLFALIRQLLNTDGLKIGGRMSQLFFNYYMTRFDHWLKEQLHVPHYFRYMDDMLLFSTDKETLHGWFCQIDDYITRNLRMTIKENHQIFPVAKDRHDRHARPVDMAGYVFFMNQTRLRKRIKQNLCHRLAQLNRGRMDKADYLQAVAPWWGWIISTDSQYLLNKLNKTAKHEIKFEHKARRSA